VNTVASVHSLDIVGGVPDDRWVLTYEYEPTRSWVPAGVRLPVGRALTIGREGDLPLGLNVPDKGVSRVAVEVAATEDGWEVNVRNSNRAVLHAWGQAPRLVSGRLSLAWPRIAIRVLNGEKLDPSAHHWLLLEADALAVTPAGPRASRNTAGRTVNPRPPLPLSGAQEQALRLVFTELLRWPPRLPATPLKLSTAARRLGISEAGVKDRLGHAHDRALWLGLHTPVGLTNPEYLYVLVRAGYLASPAGRPHRVTPAGLGDPVVEQSRPGGHPLV
jgi:hypothetical protein